MNLANSFLVTLAVCGVAGSIYVADQHVDTRHSLIVSRRIARSDHTMIAFKNAFFKQSAARILEQGELDMSSLALDMSRHEKDFPITYVWGGSIKNHLSGLDCTGFIHGLMYYLGYPESNRRFNTKGIYLKLRRDTRWETLHDSAQTDEALDATRLRVGDVIVWPSDLDDGRNLPGPIWGHIGVVTQDQGRLLVTHYVHSDAYDALDVIGPTGPGINTLPAADFIRLKQRGLLGVFRKFVD